MGRQKHSQHDFRRAVVAVSDIAQGDIWWAETEEGRRPVLVVTRSEAIPVLKRIMVAPTTRTIRNIPTELPLSREDGLPQECVASFDNLGVVLKSHLTERIGSVIHRKSEFCAALRVMADC